MERYRPWETLFAWSRGISLALFFLGIAGLYGSLVYYDVQNRSYDERIAKHVKRALLTEDAIVARQELALAALAMREDGLTSGSYFWSHDDVLGHWYQRINTAERRLRQVESLSRGDRAVVLLQVHMLLMGKDSQLDVPSWTPHGGRYALFAFLCVCLVSLSTCPPLSVRVDGEDEPTALCAWLYRRYKKERERYDLHRRLLLPS